MKKTKNYAMPYPEQDDYFNVEDFQDMMVSVDDLMKKLSDSGAQISSDAEHLYNQTKAQMDNIQKRMNAFTALKEGSTTGDAELTDIRVAYDGKKYGNAGEAVREQASDIHKALFGAGASIWSKAKSESKKYVVETKGICILNERFTAAGVVAKISRGTFAQNESTLNLDRECSAYIVEFEKNPGTVYMPSAETIKIVSTTKIIFEANGNARCWIPVEKGQYLAVDSTATAYTYESNHVPYMLYDQANETLECRGFGSAGSIEPVDPYSLALEYKLEYDMDDTGLVKQIDANREVADSLKEDIGNIKKKKNVVIYVGSAELSAEQKLSCDYVCDGIDDQIEINQAIDSLPDSGGEIHLSRGIFNITNSITIMKRIKITGEGKGITLDRNSVNNGGTTLLSELTGGCIILIQKSDTLSDIKGITLSDFQIVGAGINVENNYCNGINVETYTDCVTLERLAICHCFYGLFVGQSATVDDISVTNCDFQRDATGIYIYGQGWQTRIENNIFWDMSGRSETVGIVLSAGKNIVNGNYFGVSSLLNQGVACAWISAKNGVSLLCNGNSFSRCTSSPIRFEAGGQFASISGNSFSEIGKAQFQPNERAVLYIDGAGTGGGRISFTNNTVFWANGDDWKTSYLAYLTNRVAQVNISNNTVIDGIGKINEDELVYKSEDSTYAITIGGNVLC